MITQNKSPLQGDRGFTVRLITPTDCEAALEVYRPYVEKTAYTFEYVVPTIEQFTEKIKKITAQYPWLVCEYKGRIIGYAYGSTHRDRTAYQWSPESTVYIAEDFHRLGIARILYEALFDMLKLQGFYNVYAGVLVTNESSCRFHESMGFYEVGLFKRVGYKLGKWHDNMWYQLHLSEHISEPPTPKVVGEVMNTQAFKEIIEKANEKIQTNHR
jgi:L-amino acid N-acyltransferase YncA